MSRYQEGRGGGGGGGLTTVSQASTKNVSDIINVISNSKARRSTWLAFPRMSAPVVLAEHNNNCP